MPYVARLGCKISCEIKRADWELLFSSADNKGSTQKTDERKDFLFFFFFFLFFPPTISCWKSVPGDFAEAENLASTEWDVYVDDEHTL